MSAPPPTSTAQPLAAAAPVQGTKPAVSELQEKVELATAEAKASFAAAWIARPKFPLMKMMMLRISRSGPHGARIAPCGTHKGCTNLRITGVYAQVADLAGSPSPLPLSAGCRGPFVRPRRYSRRKGCPGLEDCPDETRTDRLVERALVARPRAQIVQAGRRQGRRL